VIAAAVAVKTSDSMDLDEDISIVKVVSKPAVSKDKPATEDKKKATLLSFEEEEVGSAVQGFSVNRAALNQNCSWPYSGRNLCRQEERCIAENGEEEGRSAFVWHVGVGDVGAARCLCAIRVQLVDIVHNGGAGCTAQQPAKGTGSIHRYLHAGRIERSASERCLFAIPVG
jgi:hypothetical protein